METASSPVIDLDKLISDFNAWEEVVLHCTLDLLKSNSQLSFDLKLAQKQSSNHQEAAKASSQEATQLRECIDKLQASLTRRCDLDDENGSLKKEMLAMKSLAEQVEQEHKKQMAEAVANLQVAQEEYKKEIQEVQEKTKQQMQCQIESLERNVREKTIEVKQLQKQNADLERARHTEVIKLRLEYDAKLLKFQKQSARNQAPQSSSFNNEIFRKKLQHAKAESEREIGTLQRKVAELERQLLSQQQPTTKKRRIY